MYFNKEEKLLFGTYNSSIKIEYHDDLFDKHTKKFIEYSDDLTSDILNNNKHINLLLTEIDHKLIIDRIYPIITIFIDSNITTTIHKLIKDICINCKIKIVNPKITKENQIYIKKSKYKNKLEVKLLNKGYKGIDLNKDFNEKMHKWLFSDKPHHCVKYINKHCAIYQISYDVFYIYFKDTSYINSFILRFVDDNVKIKKLYEIIS